MTRASSPQVFERQREAFRRMTSLAWNQFGAGRHEAAGAIAQMAAEYAWRRHAGEFGSPSLEALGARLSSRLRVDRGEHAGRRRPAEDLRVLHVLSEAYAVGGHTQIAWRWIESDSARVHSVALTRQGDLDVPDPIERVVARSGGTVSYLDRACPGVMARAEALTRLLPSADLVVLHVHPWDLVPVLALAGCRPRPPVVYVNHADHVLWLGVTVADLVVHSRDVAMEVAARRRGVPFHRSLVFPFPLPPAHAGSRSDARRELGLGADETILLTAASAYKYSAGDTPDFVELIVPVLQQNPDVRLLAFGPADAGTWAEGSAATDGRLQALGPREDVRAAYAAADVYLDSTPLTSVTSLLEAGQHGLPLIRFSSTPDGTASLFEPNIAALSASVTTTRNVDEYRETVTRLIRDVERRRSVGEAARANVLADHGESTFLRSLDEIYRAALEVPRGAMVPPALTCPALEDRQLAELHAHGDISAVFLSSVRKHAAPLDRRDRASFWRAAGAAIKADQALFWDWIRVSAARARRRLQLRRG